MSTSLWDNYPASYRSKEINQILQALRIGECMSIIGLSGSGKSNLLGFMSNRMDLYPQNPSLVLVDCNRMKESTPEAFLELIVQALLKSFPTRTEQQSGKFTLDLIEELLSNQRGGIAGLSLLIDRFEVLERMPDSALVYSNLRALRDSNKYWLTLAPATRRPLEPNNELAELCYAHTLWLGPLSESDAHWTISAYAGRVGQKWDGQVEQKIMELSWSYPSFLRSVCEAYANGAPLEIKALLQHPSVERRIVEFWSDNPDEQAIEKSGLKGHPFLTKLTTTGKSLPIIDESQLTAKEHLLWDYLRSHPNQVIEKDVLIQAVWPEDKIYSEGIRDDSLAQLIRRLRVKVEPNPAEPIYIHTIPGRGIRFTPRTLT